MGTVSGVAKIAPGAKLNFVFYFAIVYISHGISCGQFGIIAQPIQFFMMKGLNLTAAEVSGYMAIMMLPWVIKPVYGLLCDFLPLFGYRRKSYVIMGNVVTALALVVIAWISSLPVVLVSLMFTAIGMAISTAMMVGLAVQQGRRDGHIRDYFAVQEFCYYSASILSAALGGMLCQNLIPVQALRYAAVVAVFPAVCIATVTALKYREEKSRFSRKQMQLTFGYLRRAFSSPLLRLAMTFSLLWCFNPAMGVPLYFYESNSLKFTQNQIGQLSACNAFGMLIGTLFFGQVMKKLALKSQVVLTISLACLSILGYLGISSFESGVVLELLRGTSNIIVIILLYVLAAEYCPPRVEVSVMAILVAFRNIATDASTFVGGQLFTHVFHNEFRPLVFVSLIAPLVSALLVPMFFSLKENTRELSELQKAPEMQKRG